MNAYQEVIDKMDELGERKDTTSLQDLLELSEWLQEKAKQTDKKRKEVIRNNPKMFL